MRTEQSTRDHARKLANETIARVEAAAVSGRPVGPKGRVEKRAATFMLALLDDVDGIAMSESTEAAQ